MTHILTDRPSGGPPETITGTRLEQARNFLSAKTLDNNGPKEISLIRVGDFLRDVGVVLRTMLEEHDGNRILFNTEVMELQQTPDKTLWRVKTVTSGYEGDSFSGIKGQGENAVSGGLIFSHFVVLATGGQQRIPIMPIPSHASKVIGSDYACTSAGVQELADRIRKSGKRRVVIIGGSHSAFSSAWICLHKLGLGDDFVQQQQQQQVDGNNTTSTSADNSNNNTNSQNNSEPFSMASICIIHRGPIRVFYNTRKEAELDGCKDIPSVNKYGQVNPFCGLRGDAKVSQAKPII